MYILDSLFILNFANALQDFIDSGGFERPEPPCITETWERGYRQQVCCIHGVPRKRCNYAGCYSAPKPYMPSSPYGH